MVRPETPEIKARANPMVTCPNCSSDDIDLVEKRADGTRLVRCDGCGHQWPRGEPRPVKNQTPHPEAQRSRRDYSPSEIQAHPLGTDHFLPALRWWSEEDEINSFIAPTLENPYCIQPYDVAFFKKGTRGYDGLCYIEEHSSGTDAGSKWMAKPHKQFWYSMCEYHARQWTGWHHRMLPRERYIKVFSDNDTGFEYWTSRYGGYVLTQRSPAEYMLHLADCVHLERESDWLSITKTPRRWAKASRNLIEWTNEMTGTDPLRCSTCM